jgi:hypothetical protein
MEAGVADGLPGVGPGVDAEVFFRSVASQMMPRMTSPATHTPMAVPMPMLGPGRDMIAQPKQVSKTSMTPTMTGTSIRMLKARMTPVMNRHLGMRSSPR